MTADYQNDNLDNQDAQLQKHADQSNEDMRFPDGEPDEADFSQIFKILRKQKGAMDTMVDSVNGSTR